MMDSRTHQNQEIPNQVDFLVIGSGIAGLYFALQAAAHGRVLIVTKSDADESNTKYAQGGIAAVTNQDDSLEQHVQDTLIAGDGLCDEEVVRMVIGEGPRRVRELIAWGTQFDRKSGGGYDLAREGGHSASRILHHKDVTGYEIESKLLAQVNKHPNITLCTHLFAIDLITQHHLGERVTRATPHLACYGIYALNLLTGHVHTVRARITLMASGGAGSVYLNTTNPSIATGDGIAMAYRAKAQILGMEFIQFHPTALYHPSERPSFLISEAVRGSGGILKTSDGKEFMDRYDARLSLAPRDIVARAIDNEMKTRGDEYVYLDCRHIDPAHFTAHFPNIESKCRSLGIDFRVDMIPVVPAAHYTCGGIATDMEGRTSIDRLYAAGECARTGLHGANRLASNSLLEAAVYAHRAAADSTSRLHTFKFQEGIPEWDASGTKRPDEMVLITQNTNELQQLMSHYVGIVRTNLRLQRAHDRLAIIYQEAEGLYQRSVLSQPLLELRNLVNIAYLIVRAAMERKENRGLHYNADLAGVPQSNP